MEKISCVYTIGFLNTDKKYVGSTKNFAHRRSSHLSCLKNNKHSNSYLQNAFNKYGVEYITFTVLEHTLSDKKTLQEREQSWLDELKTYNRDTGFNLSKIAHLPTGSGNSDENKRRNQSKFMKGKQYAKGSKRSPEFVEWQKATMLARKRIASEETKQKIRKAHLGKIVSDSTKAKLREINLGTVRTMESRITHSKNTARLSAQQVIDLRRRYSSKIDSIQTLSEEIGYSYKTTWKIVTGRAYMWVE